RSTPAARTTPGSGSSRRPCPASSPAPTPATTWTPRSPASRNCCRNGRRGDILESRPTDRPGPPRLRTAKRSDPMATVHGRETIPARTPRVAGPRRWRWTAKQYHKLANMGFFGDRKVELINGELFPLPTNPPHDTAVHLTSDALRAAFGAGYYIRAQAT